MKKAIVPALALAAGVALGFFFARGNAEAAKTAVHEDAPKRHHRQTVEEKTDNASAALRARIRDLEAQLAELTLRLAATNESARVERTDEGRREPPRDFAKRMEDMKANDPERYAQMTNRMATWRANSLRQTENRLEMLASVDVSRMTAKERETHERLQELLARREELFDQMRPDSGLSGEERHAKHEEVRRMFGELRQLEEAERNTLLRHAANDLGFTGKEAKEVVESIKSIYEATQMQFGPPHGGRGRRGR